MSLGESLNSLRGGNKAKETDRSGISELYLADGVDSRAARCKHRVNNKNVAVADILGQLAVILNGLERFLVSVKADVADSCRGNKRKNSVNHAETRAENGNNGKLFACKVLNGGLADRGFNFNVLKRKVARCFIAHEHCYLRNKGAEIL